MKFHQSIPIAFLLLFFGEKTLAQTVEEVPYKREMAAGINFNTNGGIIGGVMFKRTVHIKKNQYHLFAFELVNVKHPKEQRTSSPVTGNTFIYYKQNYLFVLRPQYGREFLLFRKSEEEGVRVNGIVAGGLSFGILKPYAIDYDYTNYSTGYNGPPKDVRSEPFDPSIHHDPQGRILGTGGLFTGIGFSKIVPGVNFKTGLSFEFGNSATGVEVGGLLELYPKRMVIISDGESSSIFSSIYINIFLGSKN